MAGLLVLCPFSLWHPKCSPGSAKIGLPYSHNILLCRQYQKGFSRCPTSSPCSAAWTYYAVVKTNSVHLITINSIGLFIEAAYIVVFLVYAPKNARIFCIRIFVLLDVVGLAGIVLLTQLLFAGSTRVAILGWICVGFAVSVFAAPLGIIRLVIRTKSVEFMPFNLSFFLTLSAIAWFCYGLFTKTCMSRCCSTSSTRRRRRTWW